MKIEKFQQIAVNVQDMEKAIHFFSDLFDTTFESHEVSPWEKTTIVRNTEVSREKIVSGDADRFSEELAYIVASSPIGLELIQYIPPTGEEGVISFHFKVPDLEEAKKEMKAKGVHLVADIKVGNLKEAIFDPNDLHGCRIILIEYSTPTLTDAMLQK